MAKELKNQIIDVSDEVTRIDGTNNGIWYFGDRLNIEEELIIGFSPTNYHCFIICGNTEFHPRFSINPCKVQPSRKDNVRAAFFIRIKNISQTDLLNFQSYLKSLEGKRTPTCHQGLLYVLDKGMKLKIPGHMILKTTPRSLLRGIMLRGLIDQNQKMMDLEVYTTRKKTLDKISFDVSVLTVRYSWVFSLSNLYYKIMKLFRPQIFVR